MQNQNQSILLEEDDEDTLFPSHSLLIFPTRNLDYRMIRQILVPFN